MLSESAGPAGPLDPLRPDVVRRARHRARPPAPRRRRDRRRRRARPRRRARRARARARGDRLRRAHARRPGRADDVRHQARRVRVRGRAQRPAPPGRVRPGVGRRAERRRRDVLGHRPRLRGARPRPPRASRAEPVSTQVVPRDRHAALMQAIALAGAGLERLATEIRHLQRTEVREAEEPFRSGQQKGSSAMPHKRNPIVSERICGLARVLRGNAQAAVENVALWHERDISPLGRRARDPARLDDPARLHAAPGDARRARAGRPPGPHAGEPRPDPRGAVLASGSCSRSSRRAAAATRRTGSSRRTPSARGTRASSCASCSPSATSASTSTRSSTSATTRGSPSASSGASTRSRTSRPPRPDANSPGTGRRGRARPRSRAVATARLPPWRATPNGRSRSPTSSRRAASSGGR